MIVFDLLSHVCPTVSLSMHLRSFWMSWTMITLGSKVHYEILGYVIRLAVPVNYHICTEYVMWRWDLAGFPSLLPIILVQSSNGGWAELGFTLYVLWSGLPIYSVVYSVPAYGRTFLTADSHGCIIRRVRVICLTSLISACNNAQGFFPSDQRFDRWDLSSKNTKISAY